jgi:very-short-patch-repair endonuclease
MRMTLDQLNPDLQDQVRKKLDSLRARSTERTVVVAGSDDEKVKSWKHRPRKGNQPLIPKISSIPEERLAFHLRAEGITHFQREYVFWPERKFRADFAFVLEWLLVEVDGGLHQQGRHTRADGFEKDCTKLNEAALMGWRVLRFSPAMVSSGFAVNTIKRALGMT